MYTGNTPLGSTKESPKQMQSPATTCEGAPFAIASHGLRYAPHRLQEIGIPLSHGAVRSNTGSLATRDLGGWWY